MRQNGGGLWLGTGLGLSAGALLMFYLDPSRGRRRRALVRDKFRRASHVVSEGADGARRDLRNRLHGLKARADRLRRAEVPADDTILTERVRAQLGRFTTHARNIEVDVRDGEVTLRGNVSSAEAKRVVRAARSVAGVCNVIDLLDDQLALTQPRPSFMSVPVAVLIATGAAGAAVAARAAVNRNGVR